MAKRGGEVGFARMARPARVLPLTDNSLAAALDHKFGFVSGVISRGTRGNAAPVVEKLPERMGTAFLLLNRRRTHYGPHCEPFSGLKCTIYAGLCIYNRNFFSSGNIPLSPAFALFLFYETTTDSCIVLTVITVKAKRPIGLYMHLLSFANK